MKKKRKTLTSENKFEIICEFKKGGKTKTDFAQLYNIPENTLTGVLDKKDEIIGEYQTSSSSPKRKRHCSGKYEGVDTG